MSTPSDRSADPREREPRAPLDSAPGTPQAPTAAAQLEGERRAAALELLATVPPPARTVDTLASLP